MGRLYQVALILPPWRNTVTHVRAHDVDIMPLSPRLGINPCPDAGVALSKPELADGTRELSRALRSHTPAVVE